MQPTQHLNGKAVLYVSLELAAKAWKVGLTDGQRANASVYSCKAEQALARLEEFVRLCDEVKRKWDLPADCEVEVIYEAGQDGFWIERELVKRGMRVHVVDPASVPVSRHAKRAKTDRLDALALVNALRAWLRGEGGEIRMVHVPTAEQEAQRHLSRDRGELQKEIGQHRDRMRKLLRLQGCWDDLEGDVEQRLASGELCRFDGTPLDPHLRDRLLREWQRLQLGEEQYEQLNKDLVKQLPEAQQQTIASLMLLRGLGPVGSMRLELELFWRDFKNRRQVGACVGLVPQPYDSGETRRDQGISKQGNRRVRSLLIELSWMWLRYQPNSAISQWFAQRTAGSGPNKRGKRIAIVAVARRLAIALWRYVRDGVVPEGAELKKRVGHAI